MEYILLVLISLIVFSFIFSIKENFDSAEYKKYDYSTITNSLNNTVESVKNAIGSINLNGIKNNLESNIESKIKDCVGSKEGPCVLYGLKPCTGYSSIPYGCNWGCTNTKKICNRWNWHGHCTGHKRVCSSWGNRSTCHKQGPCNKWGDAPCISRPSVPTWKC